MKNIGATGASMFLKNIFSMLCSITKSKSLAIRNKTNALKARLIVLSLLKDKKFSLGSISHKVQAILGRQDKKGDEEDEESKAIVLYNAASGNSSSAHTSHVGDQDDQYNYYYIYNNDDKYPDLTHSLFEEEEDELDLGDPNGSVIDLVKNSKEGGGEGFKLEDEIDHVADLFIMKFHKRMRLQKLESFKRYQDMLQRSV